MAPSKLLAILIAFSAGGALAQDVPPLVEPPKPDVATDVPPCQPRSLVSMTVRVVTPGLQAADPRAQPKRLWRKGGRFLRSLDQPVISQALQDPKARSAPQALAIIAEPDIWMIDQASREGRHTVDKGPVLEVRAPILPVGGAPSQFMALEYGCEAEFVAVRAPAARGTVRWGDVDAAIHTYSIGADSVALLMDDRAGKPLMITYVRENRPIYIVRYDSYETGLPDQPELFRPPGGVTITEAAAAPPGSRPLD
jgi:hypothetical protein